MSTHRMLARKEMPTTVARQSFSLLLCKLEGHTSSNLWTNTLDDDGFQFVTVSFVLRRFFSFFHKFGQTQMSKSQMSSCMVHRKPSLCLSCQTFDQTTMMKGCMTRQTSKNFPPLPHKNNKGKESPSNDFVGGRNLC